MLARTKTSPNQPTCDYIANTEKVAMMYSRVDKQMQSIERRDLVARHLDLMVRNLDLMVEYLDLTGKHQDLLDRHLDLYRAIGRDLCIESSKAMGCMKWPIC